MRVRPQQGQASVELALVLPVVVLVLLAAVQVAIVGRAQLEVANAARAGARAAAVDRRPGAAHRAAVDASPALKEGQVATDTSHHGEGHRLVTVRVRYIVRTDVPLVGVLLPDIRLVSTATFRDESGQSASAAKVFGRKPAGTAS